MVLKSFDHDENNVTCFQCPQIVTTCTGNDLKLANDKVA